jgi:hypothetical protein
MTVLENIDREIFLHWKFMALNNGFFLERNQKQTLVHTLTLNIASHHFLCQKF